MDVRNYIKKPRERSPPYKRDHLSLQTILAKKGSSEDESRNLLNHIDKFSYATLAEGRSTLFKAQPYQEMFYLVEGRGEVLTRDQRGDIKKDYAFIIPPNIPYSLINLCPQQPLELLVITEEPPQNPSDKITIKNTEEIPLDKFDPPLHWCHRNKKIFSYEEDNLGKVHYVSLVYIPPEKLPEPHKHYSGHDEVWHALEGRTEMAFRDNHFEHFPGTSILIPDDGKTEHTSITGKEEAIFFFFMHHTALDNRLVVTGSRGRIGRIIVDHLKNRGYQFLTEIDKRNSENRVDILYDNIDPDFRNKDTVIHLAANPDPFLDRKGAENNIAMTRKVIEACKNSGSVKRIIYASSINVYPYRDIDLIRQDTPLTPNTSFNPEGNYGRSKIECERLLEEYCKKVGTSLINLRLGWITESNAHPEDRGDIPHPRDLEVALKHEDLKWIIDKAIEYQGIGSYICVSKRGEFISDDILFPV